MKEVKQLLTSITAGYEQIGEINALLENEVLESFDPDELAKEEKRLRKECQAMKERIIELFKEAAA